LDDAVKGTSGTANADAPLTTAPEDYGDFMSYYIAGNDEAEEPESANTPSKSASRKHNKQKRKSRSGLGGSVLSADNQRSGEDRANDDASAMLRSHSASEPKIRSDATRPSPLVSAAHVETPRDSIVNDSGHVARNRQVSTDAADQTACRPHVHRSSVIQWVDIIPATQPPRPSTVSEMIEKVNYLSSALAGIGGPVAQDEVRSQIDTNMTALQNSVDQLSKDREDHDSAAISESNLVDAGSDDEPLVHGINFIQNALRSWAQQRLANETFHRFQIEAQQHELTAGGSAKTAASSEEVVVVTCDLATTPEGVTIKAFQEVLDSGCLRMNLIVPSELSLALRRLYVQIDHLINQDQQNPSHWQCMSYNAQLAAHQKRIGIWQEARSRAQEELMKQQRMVDSQLMAQLNSIGSPASASGKAPERSLHKQRFSSALHKSLPNGKAESPHGLSGMTAIRPKPDQASTALHPFSPATTVSIQKAPTTSHVRATQDHVRAEPVTLKNGHRKIGSLPDKRPARVRLSVTKPSDPNEQLIEKYTSNAIAEQQPADSQDVVSEENNPAGPPSPNNLTVQPVKNDPALRLDTQGASGKLPRHSLRSPASLARLTASSPPKALHAGSTPSKTTRNAGLLKSTSTASIAPLKDDPPGTLSAQSPNIEGADSQPAGSPQLGRSMRVRRSSRRYEESKNLKMV
jgi:hypothetical protein